MYEHSDGGYDLEPRADDEREEGTETHEDRLREVPAVVEQFPRHGADERPQDDAYGREDENPANTPTVAPMAPAREPPNLRVIHAGRK